jgi:hypothetical protein
VALASSNHLPLLPRLHTLLNAFHNDQPRKRHWRLQGYHLYVRVSFLPIQRRPNSVRSPANPNTSAEAKEHAKEVVEEFEASGTLPDKDEDKNVGNVVGGHKATLK